MVQQILTVVAPVMLIALLGYVWDRKGLPFDTAMVSTLASNVGAPCLLLSTLLARRPDLGLMLDLTVAAAGLIGVGCLFGAALLRFLRLPLRVYLPAMIFPNSGNMGVPLSMFAFGDAGLVAAVAFFAAISLFQFSLGISLASGRFSVRGVLSSPVLWAMFAALAMIRFDIPVPEFAANTIQVLAGLVIPLMMLSLGTSLARLKVTALGRSVGFSLFRLGTGFAIALGMTHLLGLSGAARGAVMIQSAMPTAVFNYLFALRYDNRPDEVAGIVVISTLLSFLTLPLLLAFVLG
jgi:predicted permease